MKPFPLTLLVIEGLEANDKQEGREVAMTLIRLAREGNASMLKLLYDRVEPQDPFTDETNEELTDEERIDRFLRLVERARARRDQPTTRS